MELSSIMKEELTTKMHSEFSIEEETDVKHRCFCALKCIKDYFYSIEKASILYDVSPEDIEKFKSEFEQLSSE